MGVRPLFNVAWIASQQIFRNSDSLEQRRQRVATMIGGNVAFNINHKDPKLRWKNLCAVRMSYILNHSGLRIPHVLKETVTGEDKKFNYFYRIKNIIQFLRVQWGPPQIVPFPQYGDKKLAKKKGVILFEVSGWPDAMGHATLFNGSSCYDSCIFYESEATYRTDRANFWKLL